MAAASDSVRGMINESLDRIDKLENKWMLYTVNPYSMAYDDALEAFKAKMKEQEEEDKAESLVLSLAMIALSLCGGGILTAAFGSAVLKTITVDAATKIICNNNMERAFKAAHFIATNKTASFIAGKVWDEAESKATAFVSDKIKSGLSQNAASFPSTTRFQSMTSFKMSKTLEQFIREAKDKASDLITGLRDNNNIGDMERLQQLSKIEKGSFFNPPTKNVDDGTLGEDLELAFYMNLILNSDYLETYERYTRRVTDGLGSSIEYALRAHKSDLTELPSSPNYPKRISGEQDVLYNKVGGKLRERMNELYKKKLRTKDGILDGKINDRTMLNAERTIDILASNSIKKRIETVVQ